MSNQTSQPLPDDSHLNPKRVLSIGGFLAVTLFAGYLYMTSQQKERDAEAKLQLQSQENQQLQSQMANLEVALADLKTAKVYEQQEQAVSKSNAMSVLETGEVLQKEIQRFGEIQQELATRIRSLATSEEGRRIASDLKLVELANGALNVTLPSDSRANSLRVRLDGLLSGPKGAIQNKVSGYSPGESLLTALAQIELETRDLRAVVERVLSDLNVVARKAAELPQNANRTLEQSLAELQAIKDQQRSELISQVKEDAKLEGAKRIADQEAENERKIAAAKVDAAKLLGDQNATKIITDAQVAKEKSDVEKRIQEAEMARAKLESEFNRDLGEIRNYLTAFVSDGFQYRGDNSTKGPASLTSLRGTQIFQPGRTGLEAILRYAGNSQNDRPRGPIGEYIGGDYGWQLADKDSLNKVQSLLIKYADLMVEKGLLAR